MQKLRARNGSMFRWACDPPTFPSALGVIATRLPTAPYSCEKIRLRQHPVRGGGVGVLIGLRSRGVRDVGVLRHLGDRQRVCLLAAALAKRMAAADVDRCAAPEVG
jgi:hypothetical protein